VHEQVYVQYVGRFAARQFMVEEQDVQVAPFDVSFWDDDDLSSVKFDAISDLQFEEQWQSLAEPRLNFLLEVVSTLESGLTAEYFRSPLTEDVGEFGAGVWYAEFSSGIARRQFEIYANRVLVSYFDLALAEDYDQIISDEHFERISFRDFQTLWTKHAIPRLREIMQLKDAQ
jgi:hypothetical protein